MTTRKKTHSCMDCGVEVSYRSKRCVSCQRKHYNEMQNAKRRADGRRQCGHCKEWRDASEFSRSRNAAVWCKPCCRETAAKWRADHPEQVKATEATRSARRKVDPEYRAWQLAYRLMAKYGLTPEQFEEMWDRQDGHCAICGDELKRGREGLHVDHDHVTGLVRGLLCRGCNQGLGHFRDNPDALVAAAAYLVLHQAGLSVG